jgi:hypothetical protein
MLPRRATQRSVKFIRWLRLAIREKFTEASAAPHLKQLHATLWCRFFNTDAPRSQVSTRSE